MLFGQRLYSDTLIKQAVVSVLFNHFDPFWPLTPDNIEAFSSAPTAAHRIFCSLYTLLCKHYHLIGWLSICINNCEWLHHLIFFLICMYLNCCYTENEMTTATWSAQFFLSHEINSAQWRRQALAASGFGISAVHCVCIWWCLLSGEVRQLVG